VYETHYWKLLLASLECVPPNGAILELLPGKTMNLPIALESLGFTGGLDRLDLMPQPLLAFLRCRCRSLYQDAFTFVKSRLRYDVVVANHVVDDLLMYLHFRERYYTMPPYSHPDAARSAWAHLAAAGATSDHSGRLARLFEEIVFNMPARGTLVLREYPSTFELRTGDLGRTDYLAKIYRHITDRLKQLPGTCSAFLDLCSPLVPLGQRFPYSLFVIRKH
jgi:hypothetical protein